MVRGQELRLWSEDQDNGTEVAPFEPAQCGRTPRWKGAGTLHSLTAGHSRGANGVIEREPKSTADDIHVDYCCPVRRAEHIPILPHFYNRKIRAHEYDRSSNFRLFVKYFSGWLARRDGGKSVLKSDRWESPVRSFCRVFNPLRSESNEEKITSPNSDTVSPE